MLLPSQTIQLCTLTAADRSQTPLLNPDDLDQQSGIASTPTVFRLVVDGAAKTSAKLLTARH
jgi:hypothetical protein